jgi:hypothetical protein
LVRSRASSNADLEAIAGVGDSRIGKYGLQFLEAMKAASRNKSHEANGKPV